MSDGHRLNASSSTVIFFSLCSTVGSFPRLKQNNVNLNPQSWMLLLRVARPRVSPTVIVIMTLPRSLDDFAEHRSWPALEQCFSQQWHLPLLRAFFFPLFRLNATVSRERRDTKHLSKRAGFKLPWYQIEAVVLSMCREFFKFSIFRSWRTYEQLLKEYVRSETEESCQQRSQTNWGLVFKKTLFYHHVFCALMHVFIHYSRAHHVKGGHKAVKMIHGWFFNV